MAKEERILVVDDVVVVRELMTDILEDEGYTVVTAPNGKRALEMVRESADIVVVFTDIMMPEMDGIELIHEARKIAPDLVPIVMTGYATLETARAAVKEGAYDYVLKPFNLSEIKLAVTNALERRRLMTENALLNEISELLNISESIASILDEDELLKFVLSAALSRVGAERGSILKLNKDGKSLRVVESVGIPSDMQNMEVSMEGTISGWVAGNMQPLLVENIKDNPHVATFGFELDTPSFVSVPIERRSCSLDKTMVSQTGLPNVLAVMNVTDKRGGGVFSESDLKLLNIIANHTAAAMENARLLKDIEEGQREIIFTLGEIVETRSKETGNHVKRVAEYSKVLARKFGLTHPECEVLRLASPLHDVGKVGIPDAILNKPGKLTPEEYQVIQTHAQLGFDMLKVTKGPVLQSAATIALQHHEKFDGTGYPQKLQGNDIHIFGRITGIADVFDALGVKRVYKEAWDLDRILDLFREERGKHFDPHLTDVFFANLDEIIQIRDAFPDA